MMRDKKALQQSDKGFGVSIPGLPGCWLQGATEQEAIEKHQGRHSRLSSVVEEQLRSENICKCYNSLLQTDR